MTAVSKLRELFPDKDAVKIYPDDFRQEDGQLQKHLIFEELIDRRQGHFSDRRLAVLFRPGTYSDINFPVGYWTQVLGLGETPDRVKFNGKLGVYALPANTDNPSVGSLDTFWRSAENFQMDAEFIRNDEGNYSIPIIQNDDVIGSLAPNNGTYPSLYPLPNLAAAFPEDGSNYKASKGMLWAVSQAAPLRRIHVKEGNLHLSLGDNCASGGFIGNVDIGGYLLYGSQQQFMARNCDVAEKVFAGAWSMVFNGCRSRLHSPDASLNHSKMEWLGPAPLVAVDPQTSFRIEKPFIFVHGSGEKVFLAIPRLQRNSKGTDYGGHEVVEIDNLKQARVFTPHDPFKHVQGAANNGTHIVLSPGIYSWGETLEINHTDQVVLGIGMATIQAPGTGRPCIHVSSKAEGVRISGLSLEASVISKFVFDGSTLLEWGEAKKLKKGNPHNPGAIHDLFCFVGGRSPQRTVQVQTMVKIYSSHVMGDNLWLWRADHVRLMNDLEKPNRPELSEYHITVFGECRCDTGLEVFGDHVSFYGLAVEHTYKDMLIWHGSHGTVNFYQSEMPYDVPGHAYRDVTGYRVHSSAHHHRGNGIGVYSYFRDYDDVVVESAIVHHAPNGEYQNAFGVWLNGYSGMKSIINGIGVNTSMPGRPFVVSSYVGQGIFSVHFWKGILKKFVAS